MDGSDKAAEIAEQMEQELAKMRRLAERYALVKLASKILQLEIERYREEHQDPVLIIGSRYFREMTLGSFTGLRTDVDDKGAPSPHWYASGRYTSAGRRHELRHKRPALPGLAPRHPGVPPGIARTNALYCR